MERNNRSISAKPERNKLRSAEPGLDQQLMEIA